VGNEPELNSGIGSDEVLGDCTEIKVWCVWCYY